MQQPPPTEVRAVVMMLGSVLDAHLMQASEIWKGTFARNPKLTYRAEIKLLPSGMIRLEIELIPQDNRSN